MKPFEEIFEGGLVSIPFIFKKGDRASIKAESLGVRCGYCKKEISLENNQNIEQITGIVQGRVYDSHCPHCGISLIFPEGWYELLDGERLWVVPGSLLRLE